MANDGESFEKLEVWRRAHALSIEIHRLLAECRENRTRRKLAYDQWTD
jgi:hypothetical protein